MERRNFIRSVAAGSVGLTMTGNGFSAGHLKGSSGKRIGIIGLDTSHSVAFTQALNEPSAGPEFGGWKVVAAYPRGSNDIKSSVERIPGYTEDVKKLGVEITGSIDELLRQVDAVLLETNDGRIHLEQALPVFRAGKRMFIDKPIAASLPDAIAIFNASGYYRVPVFSSSSLRYLPGIKEIKNGSAGKVIGADTYSPATIEKTHPDLFWYGIHGVEALFTVMGTGCKSVTRIFTEGTDLVTGLWNNERIGTFRGIRAGRGDYGGTAFCEKAVVDLGKYSGYNPLLEQVVKFFDTGIPPVSQEETIEIFAFMAAADESRKNGGRPVEISTILQKARDDAGKIRIQGS
ncbi:MAG TPA: Gfo/Idh/MocA family oxidoreductase [Bacteroidales bacterium]|nr:Gfo/Idh/MocA family oxidoreductase [Bacteroidales bacterium]HNR41590.1 Gfo/Idh/MocA family oxidoreductase [Bacteroidales bacterium]HPM17931.1 Gfo/Idh/MocA family oxidoreductase [Bacteroidales bacterium]HQG76896.1 Gfo/Idh/MocA family oxidoreductase [Bacteroidales bacterium]